MHPQISDTLKDEGLELSDVIDSEVIEQHLGIIASFNSSVAVWIDSSSTSRMVWETSIMILCLVVGSLSLFFKLRSPSKRLMRFVSACVSVYCISLGLWYGVLALPTYLDAGNMKGIDKTKLQLAFSVCLLGIKIFRTAIKLHVCLTYAFMNIVVHVPFYFRKNRKSLSKGMAVTCGLQLAGTCTGLLSWVYINIFSKSCEATRAGAEIWKSVTSVGDLVIYAISLVLCCCFMVGYIKSRKGVKTAQGRPVRDTATTQTVINCSVEIIYDGVVMLINSIKASSVHVFCGISATYSPDYLEYLEDPTCSIAFTLQLHVQNICFDELMAGQHIIQEMAQLVYLLAHWVLEKPAGTGSRGRAGRAYRNASY